MVNSFKTNLVIILQKYQYAVYIHSACCYMYYVHSYMCKLHTHQFVLAAVARVHAIEFACLKTDYLVMVSWHYS